MFSLTTWRHWALPLPLAAAVAVGCGSSGGGGFGSSGDDGGAPDAAAADAVPDSPGAPDGVAGDDGSGGDATLPDTGAGDGPSGPGLPLFGGSSHGTGGPAPVAGSTETAGGITYRLVVPASPASPAPLLIVFSGTEGGATMTQNLQNLGPSTGTKGFIEAVLDGVVYNGDGAAGATVLDDVRAKYDVDNDRTYLVGESAGTTAALQLGFHLRQSYFAAYWANDVNARDKPAQTAAQLGFAPWGQAGPGGDTPDATAIVTAMGTAGYRLPTPAPYAGPGSTTHGDLRQFTAAITWLPGKTRQ